MADAQPYTTVTAPAFETALRAKAKDTLATLSQIAVQASPVTFVVTGVDVTMSWGTRDVHLVIAPGSGAGGAGVYDIVMPLAWITG